MTDQPRKTTADSYATIMIGVFCTLGSMVYISQLPLQYPFVHQAQVSALAAKVNDNAQQTQVVKEQAVTAKTTAVNAKNVADKIRNEDLATCLKGQGQTDRRVAALRRDVNAQTKDIAKIKARLGIP